MFTAWVHTPTSRQPQHLPGALSPPHPRAHERATFRRTRATPVVLLPSPAQCHATPRPLFSTSSTNCPQHRFPSTVFLSTCLLFQFRLNHCFSAASPSPPWKKCFVSQDKNTLCASSSGLCCNCLSSSLPPHPSPPCPMFREGPQ